MSAAAVKIIAETLDLGHRLARLAKEDDALDLTPDQADELLRAVDAVTGALSRIVDTTYVVTTTPSGRQQQALSPGQVAAYLRGVSNEAQRWRGVRRS